ncbi:NUDIX domain-containing protein [Streptomyces sp. NPDC056257]|uniref:NUDIX hydrolase n=1 Tax=Streptomyces sp. NPDC056257 TaxID=3345765 RepID=UPI0035D93070
MSSTPSGEPHGTAALLVNPRGQYLLHLRDANKPHICDPGTWSIPGGGREGNETSREAIARELKEETGLTVPLEPFTVVDSHGPGGAEGRIQVYLGAWDGDADALPLSEGIMLRWFDARTTAHLTMCPWTQQVIVQHRALLDGTEPGPRLPAAAAAPASRPGGGALLNLVGAHLYLERDGRILLGLRHPDSAFGASHHHFLAGHCEQESAVACLIREAREEAGLVLRAEDIELTHVVHLVDPPGSRPRLQLVFRAHRWEGTVEVREPEKCVSWDWWPADALPEPIVPYARAAVEGIRAGRLYTEMGWL